MNHHTVLQSELGHLLQKFGGTTDGKAREAVTQTIVLLAVPTLQQLEVRR